jgi:hypothetical protein
MPTPSGMRGDNGASGTENLRNASVRDRSVGQTALRRLLSGLPPDSRLTQETRGGRASNSGSSNSGSVSARGVSPVRISNFRNSTEEEFRSPLFLPGWSPLNGGVSAVPFSVVFC